MDFFQAEDRARRRTRRMLVLFAFAVLGTIGGTYLGTAVVLRALGAGSPRTVYLRDRYGRVRRAPAPAYADGESPPPPSLWRPQLLAGISLGTLGLVGVASLYRWSTLREGGASVAASAGGRRVDPHTTDPMERRLLNVVEEMAIASGTPVPAVYILDGEPAINAFAAGLTTADAVVAVTRGTLERLTRDELQGVIAHEFSHILNGDMRTNMRLTAILFGILVIGLAGRGIIWNSQFAPFSPRDRDDDDNRLAILVLALGVVLLVVGYIGYCFGRLIQAGVSRQREFLADASSVQFTRNPAGLTGALRKIGGLAVGSRMSTHRAAEIGHFFFAQSSVSWFGGLWATHPALDVRIRAIDPAFDGTFIEPPERVDVAHESFVSAGLARPAPARSPDSPQSAALHSPESLAGAGGVAAFVAGAGTLTPEAVSNAQVLLDQVPPRLRDAARQPAEAPVLLYGLLLDDGDEAVRARQRSIVASRAGGEALHVLDELEPSLRQLRHEHRLPLLQLAIPTLKAMTPTARDPFAATLDDLVTADGRVSPFEFALQKLVLRALAGGGSSAQRTVQIYSFQAVADEISIVLSTLARASSESPEAVEQAFAAGAGALRLLDGRLALRQPADSDLAHLDAALDRIATASGPIKQRLLVAGATVIGADGVFRIEEIELLRAIAAALDVPMPPLAAS